MLQVGMFQAAVVFLSGAHLKNQTPFQIEDGGFESLFATAMPFFGICQF